MRREPSITRPLILALTSILVLFWLIAIGLSIRVMQHEFSEIFDSAQEETTQRLLALIVDDLGERTVSDPRSTARPVRTSARGITPSTTSATGYANSTQTPRSDPRVVEPSTSARSTA